MNKSKLPEGVRAGAGIADAARGEVREFDISTLLGSAREVVINHNGERYRLRITSNQKLILTK